jgi:hypothetical protein
MSVKRPKQKLKILRFPSRQGKRSFSPAVLALFFAVMMGNTACLPPPTPPVISNLSRCLPPNVKLTDIVSAELISFSVAKGYNVKKVTVGQKLTELKASCTASGKLVDSTGREISFYHVTGCWGNPPVNYVAILAKQRQELEQLRQHYTVIEMTCNPSGIPLA